MQIIPVLDLKGGAAVHAVRGERERYAPVRGVLGEGEDPLALALAYRDRLGCTSLYVADLDAIAGGAGHPELLAALGALGLELWVDAGVSDARGAAALVELGVARVIVGSESLAAAEQLAELADSFPARRLVLSVDLRGGVLRAPEGIATPEELAARAVAVGIERFILLDLARVGAQAGPPLDLLQSMRASLPQLAFYAGGGVRDAADLAALRGAGAAGALIATAFHTGALGAGSTLSTAPRP
jgi:phosphoribosylformimino-5-aminoimidazole carboxamide ribotide isomerase